MPRRESKNTFFILIPYYVYGKGSDHPLVATTCESAAAAHGFGGIFSGLSGFAGFVIGLFTGFPGFGAGFAIGFPGFGAGFTTGLLGLGAGLGAGFSFAGLG